MAVSLGIARDGDDDNDDDDDNADDGTDDGDIISDDSSRKSEGKRDISEVTSTDEIRISLVLVKLGSNKSDEDKVKSVRDASELDTELRGTKPSVETDTDIPRDCSDSNVPVITPGVTLVGKISDIPPWTLLEV